MYIVIKNAAGCSNTILLIGSLSSVLPTEYGEFVTKIKTFV
jgi:hypothetical protein